MDGKTYHTQLTKRVTSRQRHHRATGAPLLLCLDSRQGHQEERSQDTLRTDGVVQSLKATAYIAFKLCFGLYLWAGRTRRNDDVFQWCSLRELAYKLCSLRKDLYVFNSYGQSFQRASEKGVVFTIRVVQMLRVNARRVKRVERCDVLRR